MKPAADAADSGSGSETAKTAKDQNYAILLAKIKREKDIALYKEYRHPHDLEKTLTVALKPNESISDKDIVDDDLFEHLKRLASTPHDKYAEPVTSAMEYGWLVPDPGMKEERRWARKSSDITRNPANFARIEKKAEKTEKNAKA